MRVLSLEQHRAEELKIRHDRIINALSTKQYFKWYNSIDQINLDYKWQAWSIFHSTRSKKIRALCMEQIDYYDAVFGTSGFNLIDGDIKMKKQLLETKLVKNLDLICVAIILTFGLVWFASSFTKPCDSKCIAQVMLNK